MGLLCFSPQPPHPRHLPGLCRGSGAIEMQRHAAPFFAGTACSLRLPGERILYLTGLLVIDGFLFRMFPRSANVAIELMLIIFLPLLYTARASLFGTKLEDNFLKTLLVTNQ